MSIFSALHVGKSVIVPGPMLPCTLDSSEGIALRFLYKAM